MREIPVAVETLLKSRSMIGENKPSHEVTVSGASDGYDWEKANTWYQPSTTIEGNLTIAKKINGKIICVISKNGEYYEGECTNVSDLTSKNDSAINWMPINITLISGGYASVSRIDNELFLNITDRALNGETAKSMLYKSPSGDGGDWEYYSTVSSTLRNQTGEAGSLYINYSGCLNKLKDGNWGILTGKVINYWPSAGNLTYMNFAFYKSTDKGLTWSEKEIFGAGYVTHDYYGQGTPKYIAQMLDGTLCFAHSDNSAGLDMRLYKSVDNGETWSMILETTTGDWGGKKWWSDFESLGNGEAGLYLYTNFDDRSRIYEILNINTPEIKNLLITYTRPNTNTHANPTMQIIDNKLIVTQENYVLGIDVLKSNLPVKSISISRNKNMAGSLNLSIDNKNGEWSPDNTVNQNILFPNAEVIVKQGYGADTVQTFTGLIDRIEMSTFPQSINLSVRDKLKLVLDQTITPQVITYTAQTVEDIFTDLAIKAGLPVGTIETTGLTLAEKTFSWETYADCFSWLADLVGFEFGCDEEGKVYFKKDAIPTATDWILTFTDGTAQAYFPIVSGSDVLKSADGETTYIKDTDYEIDYETGELTSINIPDGETLMSYVFAVYSFKEGEDIISLGYTIDDNDIYSKVIVYGKNENDEVISAYKDYVSKDYYNVLSQKIMKIDVSEASTVEQLQAIADRAEMLMRSRIRIVSFAAVAVPWLQVGDLIQVIESSTTINELYRITDLNTSMDSDGYTMQITCYHHSA